MNFTHLEASYVISEKTATQLTYTIMEYKKQTYIELRKIMTIYETLRSIVLYTLDSILLWVLLYIQLFIWKSTFPCLLRRKYMIPTVITVSKMEKRKQNSVYSRQYTHNIIHCTKYTGWF